MKKGPKRPEYTWQYVHVIGSKNGVSEQYTVKKRVVMTATRGPGNHASAAPPPGQKEQIVALSRLPTLSMKSQPAFPGQWLLLLRFQSGHPSPQSERWRHRVCVALSAYSYTSGTQDTAAQLSCSRPTRAQRSC